MKNIIKFGDYFIIGIIILIIILFLTVFKFLQDRGHLCTVSVGGKEIYRLSLSENKEISVQGPIGETKMKVANGSICITEAPCKQKICKKMGKISHSGEIIVCIPNKIIIHVKSGYEQNLDGITM